MMTKSAHRKILEASRVRPPAVPGENARRGYWPRIGTRQPGGGPRAGSHCPALSVQTAACFTVTFTALVYYCNLSFGICEI